MIARVQAEAARTAREFKHAAIIDLHVLLAWLVVTEDLTHPNRDVVRANLRSLLRTAVADKKVGAATGPSISLSPTAKEYLRAISLAPKSVEKLDELLAKSGVSTTDVIVGKPAEKTDDGKPEELSGLDKALAELNSMIGLADVKKAMNDLVAIEKVRRVQLAAGQKVVAPSLNIAFMGDPGTGKTTVARLVGDIYRELGILKSGHVIEAAQSDLIAEYVGQTAVKTKKVIDKAMDGVLFIDEAYSIAFEDYGYGAECIATLVKAMDDFRDRLVVIVAGYSEEMLQFLKANPGLNSRFGRKFYFENYNAGELLEVFTKMATEHGIKVNDETAIRVKQHLEKNPTSGAAGNGRYVRELFAAAYDNMALRAAADGVIETHETTEFQPEDIPYTLVSHTAPMSLESALAELDALVGMQDVKDKMREIIAVHQASAALRKANKPTVTPAINLVFLGPPGTGKTTVARIVSKIYQALGVLPRGHLVETGREDLVAQWVGQTAPKVVDKVGEAMGGVLFIDEAYTLNPHHPNDFGGEAIAALITQVENKRGMFSLIVAGYNDEMQQFLVSNPGLKSRMDNQLEFKDYSADELLMIFLQLAQKSEVAVPDDVRQKLKKHLTANKTDGAEGNGRYARKLFDASYAKLAVRVSKLGDFDVDLLGTFDVSDIPDSLGDAPKHRNPIGF